MIQQLVLVRHTRPAVGPEICYGRMDLELAPTAASDLRACLAEIPVATRILSSPAHRCRRLAGELGGRDGVPVTIDERLLEVDFGSWEGRSWSTIPRASLDEWAHDLLDYAPGGGESLRALWRRVQQLREEVIDGAAAGLVVVSHHGPIRALAAQAAGRPPERMFTCQVPWGGVLRIQLPAAARH